MQPFLLYIHNPILTHFHKLNSPYGMTFTLFTGSTALRFTAAGAPFTAKRMRILLMNQHA
jgi:hypothetical protein